MLHVFGGLKSLVNLSNQVRNTKNYHRRAKKKNRNKTIKVSNPEIESVISKLHYRVTSIIFLVCCILVTAVEYIGNGINIACVQDGKGTLIIDRWGIS